MKLKYLGTGAAEGVPAVFCNCEVCQNARKEGGRNIRTRSQALINDDLLIDFPPDTYMHYLNYNFNLHGITELLVTHSHTDHFYAIEFEMRQGGLAHPTPEKMRIYCNKESEKKFYELLPSKFDADKYFEIIYAAPFVPIKIKDYTVVPLLANHDKSEECLIFLISQGNKTILYGNDTGFFPEETMDYLEKNNVYINLLSLDCTMQSRSEGTNHMGLMDNVEMRRRLEKINAVDENTIFIANHFSHNGGWNYEKMAEEAAKVGFLTTYDGMEVEI